MDNEKVYSEDLLEERIAEALKRMGELDPTSDEYKKISDSVARLYSLKNEESRIEAEIKLKERQEENSEVYHEREYEQSLEKAKTDKRKMLIDILVPLGTLGIGMSYNLIMAKFSWLLERTNAPSGTWLKNCFKGSIGPIKKLF